MLRVVALTGAELRAHLPILARLCTEGFRDPPHCYDGDGSYDAGHLRCLGGSVRSALFLAYDGDDPVGAATCLPLTDDLAHVQQPFLERGEDPGRYFYLAETVLLPAYRRQGLGTRFIKLQEEHARAASACDYACFCTFLSVDKLWRKLGYARLVGYRCVMAWKEFGHAEDVQHTLQFWARKL